MSSIVKSGISLSKKDLSKSRIPPVASRNVVFYHKTSGGELSIDLLALSMPSEMPTNVQATAAEISGAQLLTNKKNLSLQSSANGLLQQGLHYIVNSSTTIQLIGLYAIAGAEADEIFTGVINSAPISDLVVASAKSITKTYELGIGQTTLNLAYEYQTGVNPNDDIGIIKVFVNGVLAHRGVDYEEVDAGSGFGTTIEFYAAPVSLPYQIAVDFGVMAITDNNAIGTIESHAGAIKKLADDLAVVAGTSANDYLNANPSEIERRAFGDNVLVLMGILDVEVPVITDWIPYTPTLSNTTNVSLNTARWRRIGDTMEIRGVIGYSGTGAAGAGLSIALPSGYIFDVAKLTGNSNNSNLGTWGFYDDVGSTTVGAAKPNKIEPIGAATFRLRNGYDSNVINHDSFASGDRVTYLVNVPIQGWEATRTIRQILGL